MFPVPYYFSVLEFPPTAIPWRSFIPLTLLYASSFSLTYSTKTLPNPSIVLSVLHSEFIARDNCIPLISPIPPGFCYTTCPMWARRFLIFAYRHFASAFPPQSFRGVGEESNGCLILLYALLQDQLHTYSGKTEKLFPLFNWMFHFSWWLSSSRQFKSCSTTFLILSTSSLVLLWFKWRPPLLCSSGLSRNVSQCLTRTLPPDTSISPMHWEFSVLPVWMGPARGIGSISENVLDFNILPSSLTFSFRIPHPYPPNPLISTEVT